jgi:hypothetical protein
MANYNKQVARELLAELQETLKGTPDRIEGAPDEGPVINLICEALGKAISALKTTVR